MTGFCSCDALAGEVEQVEVPLQQVVRSSSGSLAMGVVRFLGSIEHLAPAVGSSG
jgi:hypothetical protein